MEKKKIKLITHNGPFHTDDIFACATLSLLFKKRGEKDFEIIRTRDENVIKEGDYVFDVGCVYDEAQNKFDHHQAGGAGRRLVKDVEIEYSSFGLIWKKFGLELCGNQKVADWIDRKFVAPVDADDNGFSLIEKKYEVSSFLIQDFFLLMRPTWQESADDYYKNFLKIVQIAKEILLRAITHGQSRVEAETRILVAYENTQDKRIIVLDNYYPFGEVLKDLVEPLFVLYPRESEGGWCIKTVRKEGTEFENRKDFPKSWSGLRDQELQKVTGVSDAVFCHRALFLAVAKTKEGAMALAERALSAS
jgi:uncharacterized UPF0160 family protein